MPDSFGLLVQVGRDKFGLVISSSRLTSKHNQVSLLSSRDVANIKLERKGLVDLRIDVRKHGSGRIDGRVRGGAVGKLRGSSRSNLTDLELNLRRGRKFAKVTMENDKPGGAVLVEMWSYEKTHRSGILRKPIDFVVACGGKVVVGRKGGSSTTPCLSATIPSINASLMCMKQLLDRSLQKIESTGRIRIRMGKINDSVFSQAISFLSGPASPTLTNINEEILRGDKRFEIGEYEAALNSYSSALRRLEGVIELEKGAPVQDVVVIRQYMNLLERVKVKVQIAELALSISRFPRQ